MTDWKAHYELAVSERRHLGERLSEALKALDELTQLVADARVLDLDMCDPARDGSGTDSRAPNGDDYNDLFALIEHSAQKFDL